MSELENLFSASVPASDFSRKPGHRGSNARKPDKVQLVVLMLPIEIDFIFDF